jgi:hypothetical protein
MIELMKSGFATFLKILAGLAAPAAALLFMVNVAPDRFAPAYLHTRRLFAAMGPLQTLPSGPMNPQRHADCGSMRSDPGPLSPDVYFPSLVFHCDPRRDNYFSREFSRQLKAMGEPSLLFLSRKDTAARAYRFIWLRAFHRPIAIRLVLSDGLVGQLTTTVAAVGGLRGPGALIRTVTITADSHAVSLLLARLSQAEFWRLDPISVNQGGLDGASWIVEAASDGHYKIVKRWSPPPMDPIHLLGQTFITDLAGLDLDPSEIY